MSSFNDRMIEEGFDDPSDYLDHLMNEATDKVLRIYGCENEGCGQTQITTEYEPTEREIIDFFSLYPRISLMAISMYYPLDHKQLVKYSDILYWGWRESNNSGDKLAGWHPGVVFNNNITWTYHVRNIVACFLMIRGNGSEFKNSCRLFNDVCNTEEHDKTLCEYYRSQVEQISPCPLPIRLLADNDHPANEYNTKMSWSLLKSQITSGALCKLIHMPELWTNTLSKHLTEDVVISLLNIYYWRHLHDGRDVKIPSVNCWIPPAKY